jgi:hypothetical protein
MDYNLRDLKFFETVATLGNVSRAADVLGRSQPAITKCIRRLEQNRAPLNFLCSISVFTQFRVHNLIRIESTEKKKPINHV